MNRKEKLLFAMVVLGSLTYAAWAANDTIGVTVGSGKVANLIKFATNVISETGICDATTENQCAAVSAGGALSIAGAVTNAGTFATQSVVTGPGATGAALVGNPVRIALSDGTNTQNWLTALILGDGVNGNNTGATASWLYNGTTWDRARGDATNGAFVNVKTSVLPTGAATAALQGTNTATTAHTCSTAGYSELGCLGQIDDDVKGPVAAGTARIGYTSDDVCTQKAKTNLPISQNGTSSVQLIALSGSTVIYVCSLSLVAAGATTVAITTGTGTACVTGNAAVIGSTTANIANSMSFAANGGLTLGSGTGTIAQGAASSELCMILGTNVFVSGNLTYVQQ